MILTAVKRHPSKDNVFILCNIPEATHYAILREEDYEYHQKEYALYQRIVKLEKSNLRDELSQVDYQTGQMISELLAELDAVTAAIVSAETELQKCMADCEHLVRINRERNNAERSIKGKKTHSGYIVQQSKEKEITYHLNDTPYKETVWETSIQTPYNSDVDIDLVKVQVDIEMHAERGKLMQSGLGIDLEWTDGKDSYFFHQNSPELSGKNILLDTKYRFDNKDYWVVTYLHTLPLSKVPDYMKSPS